MMMFPTPMSKVDYCATKFACVGLDEALRVEMLVQVVNIVDLLKIAKPSALEIEMGNISCCIPILIKVNPFWIVAQGSSDFIKTTVVCPAYINTGMFDGVQVAHRFVIFLCSLNVDNLQGVFLTGS